jgi:hypothetical protein
MDFKNIPQSKVNGMSFTRPDKVDQPLYVLTNVFNTPRFRTIWKHYNEFAHYVLASGAYLVTTEYALGEREYAVTKPIEGYEDRHIIINVRGESELWVKENLDNIALSHLPESAKYIARIDSDIRFMRSDWVGECIQQLQHFQVIQMFEVAQDLDVNSFPYQFNTGFVKDWREFGDVKMQFSQKKDISSIKVPTVKSLKNIENPYCDECQDGELRVNRFHPGFAWAYRRETLDNLGGLIDIGVLGSGDSHMATALVGKSMESVHPKTNQNYKDIIVEWEKRALHYVNYNVGYMKGAISHAFHGSKKFRKYGSRWIVLVDHDYNPITDIRKNIQGVYQLNHYKPQMTAAFQQYFDERNADNIDLSTTKYFLQ